MTILTPSNPNNTHNDLAGIENWSDEFDARDTSRKIQTVQKPKGEHGIPLTTNTPYGWHINAVVAILE